MSSKLFKKEITALIIVLIAAIILIIGIIINPLYLFIGLGLILFLGILFWKLEWGIYLMALLFPFINLQIFIGEDINIPYVDLAAMFVFTAWILKPIWQWASTGKFIGRKELPGIFFFLLFIAASLLSLINSENVILSFKYVLRPLAFFYLMFVIAPYNIIKDYKTLRNVLWCIWLAGMSVSLMGLASLFVVKGLAITRIVPIKIFGEYPLGTNQNLIGETLIAVIPLTAILILGVKKEFNRKLMILSMAFMALITLGTLSRAGWICLFVEALIFLAVKYRQHLKTIVPMAIMILILLLPLTYYMAALVTSDISRSANENRLLLTKIAFDAFKKHPIIGSGAGIYVNLVSTNRDYIKQFGNPLDSHGVVQKLLAESGILGLITFVLLIGYILNRLYKSYKFIPAKDPWKDIMLAFMISVVASLIFQIFNTSYYVSKLWLPIGLALAASNILIQKTKKPEIKTI